MTEDGECEDKSSVNSRKKIAERSWKKSGKSRMKKP